MTYKHLLRWKSTLTNQPLIISNNQRARFCSHNNVTTIPTLDIVVHIRVYFLYWSIVLSISG